MKRTVMVAKHPTTRHLATAMPESRSTKTPRPHQRQASAPRRNKQAGSLVTVKAS